MLYIKKAFGLILILTWWMHVAITSLLRDKLPPFKWVMLLCNLYSFCNFTSVIESKIIVSLCFIHIFMCIISSSPISKHTCTWDDSLPYVQHSYNRAIHSSTSHNPFQVGMGFQPLGPIDVALPLTSTQVESSHANTEADKATRFIQNI